MGELVKKQETTVKKQKTDVLREKVRVGLESQFDKLMKNLAELKPKEYVDAYIKLLPYIMSRMPEERPLDDDARNKLILEETKRTATIIAGGLPAVEDTNYEEED